MSELYAPYKSSSATGTQSGFKNNAWISLTDWITTEAVPAPGESPKMGDNYTITTAHVWTTGTGGLPVYLFPKTTELSGELAGDQGAKIKVFKPKIFIAGDNAASLELVNNIMNKTLILWMEKPGCPGQLVQFGSKCAPLFLDSGNLVSGAIQSGKAGYELTFETQEKYFYNGTITEYPLAA
jgi:hypothetical protein